MLGQNSLMPGQCSGLPGFGYSTALETFSNLKRSLNEAMHKLMSFTKIEASVENQSSYKLMTGDQLMYYECRSRLKHVVKL